MTGENDKLEIYRDSRGRYRWRRLAPGGRVIGRSTEGYERLSDCEANMNRGKVPGDRWEFYRDRAGQWRWRRTARNGNVVGCASEGYRVRSEAEANAERHGYLV